MSGTRRVRGHPLQPKDRPAPRIEETLALAALAHRGQRYPSPEHEPYIFHPIRIMLAVAPGEAQIVALLHDVVEDTNVSLASLKKKGYPASIVAAVDALTRRRGESYDDYIRRLSSNRLARQVKLMDLKDNLANNRRLPPTVNTLKRIGRYKLAQRILAAMQ